MAKNSKSKSNTAATTSHQQKKTGKSSTKTEPTIADQLEDAKTQAAKAQIALETAKKHIKELQDKKDLEDAIRIFDGISEVQPNSITPEMVTDLVAGAIAGAAVSGLAGMKTINRQESMATIPFVPLGVPAPVDIRKGIPVLTDADGKLRVQAAALMASKAGFNIAPESIYLKRDTDVDPKHPDYSIVLTGMRDETSRVVIDYFPNRKNNYLMTDERATDDYIHLKLITVLEEPNNFFSVDKPKTHAPEVPKVLAQEKRTAGRGKFNFNGGTLLDLCDAAADFVGIDKGMLRACVQHESVFKPGDVSSTGCTGLGQFAAATFDETVKKHNLKSNPELKGIVWTRKNPLANAIVTACHTKDNLERGKAFKTIGEDHLTGRDKLLRDYAKAYLVHNLGATGGPRFIEDCIKNPTRTISVDTHRGVPKNPANFYRKPKDPGSLMTYGEALKNIEEILDKKEGSAVKNRNAYQIVTASAEAVVKDAVKSMTDFLSGKGQHVEDGTTVAAHVPGIAGPKGNQI